MYVSYFIYNHGWVMALMRKYIDREIVHPVATRFATAYLTLHVYFKGIIGANVHFSQIGKVYLSQKVIEGKSEIQF